jgi:hypothetical protein
MLKSVKFSLQEQNALLTKQEAQEEKKRRVIQEWEEESQITIVFNKTEQNGAVNGWSKRKLKESCRVH